MSGSRPTPAEQHLGDRLAALVDGELDHDARERVLAHLATCPKCKTEADAQRRLKSVFAQSAPPPPSESFLARLQGLPGLPADEADGPGGPGSPLGGEGFAAGALGASDSARLGRRPDAFGTGGETRFGYVPSGVHAAVLPSAERGFRIHPVRRPAGRSEAERPGWRGRRFAFAAAGAVSLAAIALGGVTAGAPSDTGDSRAGGSGSNSNVTPRSAGTATPAAPDSVRRRGPLSAQGQRPGLLSGPGVRAPVAPTEVTGPLLPGAPAQPPRAPSLAHALTAPMLAGAAAMSPLARPGSAAAQPGSGPGVTVPLIADRSPGQEPQPPPADGAGSRMR